MMYRLAPATTVDLHPEDRQRPIAADEAQALKEDQEALGRWEGEGGSPHDRFGVLDQLEQRQEAIALANERARRARATWPGWVGGQNGRLTPPPRVRSDYVDFKDHTSSLDRVFGFYLIKVPAWQYTQLIRASHPTASRVARSRTQYGDVELHFLGSIDTPALD